MESKPNYLPSSDRLIAFLNAMPRTTVTLAWIREFKSALMDLLDDIDHVSIFLNSLGGLSKQGQKWMSFFAVEGGLDQDLASAVDAFTPSSFQTVLPHEYTLYTIDDGPHLETMPPISSLFYNRLKDQVPDVSDNHIPVTFEYHNDDGGFLGVIFLWRKLDRSPVSESAVHTLKCLHGFITYAFEAAIAQGELERPLFRGIFKAMEDLVNDARLADHEARVVGHLLLGKTYEQIADRMSVSVNTVRKYIKNIYHKAGVHSLNELYAAYFLPWPR